MFFPPHALLVLLVPGREQIVGVHDHVDKTVEGPKKHTMATCNELGADPCQKSHSEMVVDVQECHLVVFFAKNKEYLEKCQVNSGFISARFLLCPEDPRA